MLKTSPNAEKCQGKVPISYLRGQNLFARARQGRSNNDVRANRTGNKFGGYYTVIEGDGRGHLMQELTLVAGGINFLLLCPPFNGSK